MGRRVVTERARQERGHWKGGGWSRANRVWGERHRIGKAIRSCPGPKSPARRNLIRIKGRTA